MRFLTLVADIWCIARKSPLGLLVLRALPGLTQEQAQRALERYPR
jgi:hypothetical protein